MSKEKIKWIAGLITVLISVKLLWYVIGLALNVGNN